MLEQYCGGITVVFVCPQLNLNNRPLSQMLKSSAPAAVVEQDPLEYYEQLTAQIEVQVQIQQLYCCSTEYLYRYSVGIIHWINDVISVSRLCVRTAAWSRSCFLFILSVSF